MAIVLGSIISASDWTSITGLVSSNFAFANSLDATNKLNALWGVGWGDRGIGQSPSVVGSVVQTAVSGSQWQNLRNAVEKLNNIVDISNATLPAAANYSSGGTIQAVDYDWQSNIKQIDQNRLLVPDTNLVTTAEFTNTRTQDWCNQIQLIFSLEWSNENDTRYFFNSGGKIQIIPSFIPTNDTDPHSRFWQTLLTGTGTTTSALYAGTTNIAARNATRTTGTGGNFQSLGMYDLNAGWQQILRFSGEDLPEALKTGIYQDYKLGFYSLSTRMDSITAVNGGNGNKILFNLTFNDPYSNNTQPISPVQGTMQVQVNVLNLNPVLGNIPLGTSAIITNLSQGGGNQQGGGTQIVWKFLDIVTSNVQNYNVLTRATAAGYTGSQPLEAIVTIGAGATVGSNSTSSYALTIPSLVSGSSVTIKNMGRILGMGGTGGVGVNTGTAGSGTSGGPAILLQYPTFLDNQGIIGGGGGGGGGSIQGNDVTFDNYGGSGGGGAGSQPGAAGAPATSSNPVAQPGTDLYGGLGGQSIREASWNGGYEGATISWQAGNGGNGGNLGQVGAAGEQVLPLGNTPGTGGAAGAALVGQSYLEPNSITGDIRGTQS